MKSKLLARFLSALITAVFFTIALQSGPAPAQEPLRVPVPHDNFTVQEEMVPIREPYPVILFLRVDRIQGIKELNCGENIQVYKQDKWN